MKILRLLCLAGLLALPTFALATTTSTIGAEGASVTWTVTNFKLEGLFGFGPNEDASGSCTAGLVTTTCIVNGQKVAFTGIAGELLSVVLSANTRITGDGSSCTPFWGINETATYALKAVTLTTISAQVCTFDADYDFIAYFPTTCKGPAAGTAFHVRAHLTGSGASGYICAS